MCALCEPLRGCPAEHRLSFGLLLRPDVPETSDRVYPGPQLVSAVIRPPNYRPAPSLPASPLDRQSPRDRAVPTPGARNLGRTRRSQEVEPVLVEARSGRRVDGPDHGFGADPAAATQSSTDTGNHVNQRRERSRNEQRCTWWAECVTSVIRCAGSTTTFDTWRSSRSLQQAVR